jgi:hypothetical protein
MSLREHQLAFAQFLRTPGSEPVSATSDPSRVVLYQELVFNNVERLVAGVFPVLRSLYELPDWHGLVWAFITEHRCQTPYFLEISQEFLDFLMSGYQPRQCDPPFLTELAHYEWVELALEVSEDVLPAAVAYDDILEVVPRLSSLAWVLRYQYPVHRIGPGFQPAEAAEPCFLAVYRDREDRVQFMELNAATARLLEMLRDNATASTREVLVGLAAEMGMAEESVLAFGTGQIEQLLAQSVVLGTDP